MAYDHTVEDFVRKWDLPIHDAMEAIGGKLVRAGYGAQSYDSEIDYDLTNPYLRWLMRVWSIGRPDALESMDMMIAFTIVPAQENFLGFLPFIELFNFEGSFLDDIDLSEPLTLDDPSWENVINLAADKAGDIVTILADYFPEPTLRRWKIHFTDPDMAKTHPSIHTNEERARQDVANRLTGILDLTEKLFWTFETLRMYSAWNSASTLAIAQVRVLLDQQEPFMALKRYNRFLDTLEPALRMRVIEMVGSLNVERLGGFPDEEED
jgi:hypothetical protein